MKAKIFLVALGTALLGSALVWGATPVDPAQTVRRCGKAGEVRTPHPEVPVLKVVQESSAPDGAPGGRQPVPATVPVELPPPPAPPGDDSHGASRIEAALAATLYDQPGSPGGEAFADQVFGDLPSMSAYMADDFTNGTPWNIQTIYVSGEGSSGYATLLNATALTWSIYTASGPTPPGCPGSGSVPYWTLTLPPTDPQVSYTNGVLGHPSNVTLDLASPVSLPAGSWWFEFVPTLVFSTGGQWFWTVATSSNGSVAQVINPGGGWGQGTGWADFTWAAPGFHDLGFRFEGCTAPGAVQLADISFEAGSPNPYWTETSTNFGTPLCTVGSCGSGGGTALPRSGDWWGWFGGIDAYEHGTLSQSFTIPPGRPTTLSFWPWNGYAGGDGNNFFDVLIDGAQVFHTLEGKPTFTGGYAQVSVDLTPHADGVSYLLTFDSVFNGSGNSNFSLDDVAISMGCCPTITIDPAVLPPMQLGVPFSQCLSTLGGTGTYTYEVTEGSLPDGLTLDPGGLLSGTPTMDGASTFTVTATDAVGCSGTRTYTPPTFSISFYDDKKRSQFCVDNVTGAYQWAILPLPHRDGSGHHPG